MQKCFYHPTHDAGATCIGCKMPICQGCRDEGKNGFCAQCFKKVASIGSQVGDMKKTGMVAASQKATMVKHMGRPTGSMNVTYCFHHFDVVANGTCGTCNKPFCESCLDATGTCGHCAKLEEGAPRPNAQPRPAAAKPAPAAAPARKPTPASTAVAVKGEGPNKLVLGGIAAVIVLVVAFVLLHH